MKIKQLLMMMILLAIAGRSFADEITVSPTTLQLNAGGAAGTLEIGLNNTGNCAALQFDLTMPEGFTIVEDDIDLARTTWKKHSIGSSYDTGKKCYRIVMTSTTNAVITGNSGTVITVPIQAASTLSGNYDCTISDVIVSDENQNGTTPADVQFTISVQGLPTVTADNKSRAYGDENPQLTYTVTDGTITGTPTLSTTATATSGVGDYPITVSASDEYKAVAGTLTVTKAPLTISGGSYSIKQGEALPNFAAEYSGFKNNETSAVLTSQPVLALESGVTSASAPGVYTITVTGGAADNYEITRTNGTLTITDADPVTVTAKSYTITYGDALPNFSYTTQGATLSGEPQITCTATAASGAGTYPITITTGSVTNYNVSYVSGTLTIEKAPLTITAENKSKTYGDANPDFTCTYNGFVKGETSAVLTTQPTLSTEATAASSVGTYDINATGANAANYTISYQKGTLTVNKATLTATAQNASVKQGEATPALNIDYSGWKNGDTEAVLDTKPTASTERTTASPTGDYPITVSGGADNNYDFTYVPGTLTVTTADPVTVTAKSYTIKYGDALPDFSYTTQGATLSGEPQITCTATATSGAGTYPITITKGSVTNYNVTYENGTLTIEKAPLTAKAKDVSVKRGVATPDLVIEYTGFKNNETEDVLTTKPTISTTRQVDSAVGEYPITVTGGSAANYEITCVNGTLTVTLPDLITVTVTNSARLYGADNPTFEYTVSGGVLTGEPVLSCTADKNSAVGNYEISIAMGTISNYNVSLVPGQLTVNPAPLTITAENKSKTYGDANPDFTCTYSGFVNNETSAVVTTQPTFNTQATAASSVGTYDINATGAVAANYAITYQKGTLTVNKATLTATAQNASVKQGEATPALSIEYSGWKNSDTEAVLDTKPTASTERTPTSAIGDYPITVSGGADNNYNFTYVQGTLTVTAADPITVTATSYKIKYGDDIPTFGFTSTGATLNGTPTITCEATKTSPVGTYPIVISKGNVTNFNDTYENGTLTIEKAPLTAKAKDVSVKRGVATPDLVIEYTGFKNNETEDVLTTKPTISTTRQVDSAVGEYTITVTGGSATNYDITCVNGTLTVILPDPITVTVTNSARLYGADNPTFEYTVSGGVLTGEPVLSCTADKTSAVGNYEISIAMGTISNYNVSLVPGQLTVNPAPLTITAENKSKTYGDANPEFTCTYSGFVNNETEDVVTTKPTLTTTATATSAAGQYPITPTGAVAANYTIVPQNGTLTISKATLTATAKDASVKQGKANPAFEIEYSGWKNGDTEAVLDTKPTASTERTTASAIGTYPITVAGGEDNNYNFTYVPGTLTVTAADPVTVTANNYTIAYGDDIPSFGYTSTGAALEGTPAISCEATKTSPVGTYPIVISKGSVTNFNDTYVNGTLTIEKAPLTAKAKNLFVEQGVATPDLVIEYTGFKNNETEAVLTTKPTISTTRQIDSELGEYPITVTGGSDTNYDITCVNGTLTVTLPGLVIVTVTNCERLYGAENPTFEYTVSGGELEGEPVLSCTADKTSDVGNYEISIAMGTISNYNVALVPGQLTVNPVPLTITADDKSKTYGDANPTFTCTYTGFMNNETSAVLTTQPTLSTQATVASEVGTYDINAAGAVATNYTISYEKGTLTVNKATLTATAQNASVKQGEATPEFSIAYSGWKNEDTEAVLDTKPTASTERTVASAPGNYPITVAGGEDNNYDFTYVQGTLIVTAADQLTVTANSYTITYGDEIPTFEYTVSGGELEGEPVLSCTATKTSGVGEYEITVAQGTVTNYNVAFVPGKLIVNPAPLTITADDKTREFDEANPTFTCTYSGFVNNETEAVVTTKPTLTTTATATSEAGQYPITASGAVAPNYKISYVDGTLTVTKTTVDTSGNTIVEDGENVTLKEIGEESVDENGGLTIPENVTQIDENAFDSMTEEEKESVQYVDLSESNVSGITVDRSSGVFEGFSESTIICLPEGNDDGNEANVVIGSTCSELKLTEDVGQTIPIDFTAGKVTYERALTANDTHTLCLPYSLQSDASVTFYELASVSGLTLIFNEVATTEPNKPYLAVPKTASASFSKSASTPVNKNTSLGEKDVTGYRMLGTMQKIGYDDAKDAYILQGNNEWKQLKNSSSGVAKSRMTRASEATDYIPPFRAYIIGTTEAASLNISFGDDTGIQTIMTVDTNGDENWYDINGRKLPGRPVGDGVYIMNGKKVTIKKQ